jgi:hypothetical protein
VVGAYGVAVTTRVFCFSADAAMHAQDVPVHYCCCSSCTFAPCAVLLLQGMHKRRPLLPITAAAAAADFVFYGVLMQQCMHKRLVLYHQ